MNSKFDRRAHKIERRLKAPLNFVRNRFDIYPSGFSEHIKTVLFKIFVRNSIIQYNYFLITRLLSQIFVRNSITSTNICKKLDYLIIFLWETRSYRSQFIPIRFQIFWSNLLIFYFLNNSLHLDVLIIFLKICQILIIIRNIVFFH